LSNWQEKILLLERCRAIIKSCRADFSSNRISSRWLWPIQQIFLSFSKSQKNCFKNVNFLSNDNIFFLGFDCLQFVVDRFCCDRSICDDLLLEEPRSFGRWLLELLRQHLDLHVCSSKPNCLSCFYRFSNFQQSFSLKLSNMLAKMFLNYLVNIRNIKNVELFLLILGHWNMNFYICTGIHPYKVIFSDKDSNIGN
jgi:hypothetical protein